MPPEGTTLAVGSHKATITKYLSEGGFSKIFQVKMDPPEDGTDIGCLKQVIVTDKSGLNALRKEVEVMKTLRKAKHIVRYYDSHAERLQDGTYQVLVLMELCPNKSLLDYMNERIRTKLSESEILKILLDISLALYEMHKIKLVHRDVKIENVLIDAHHVFKLCDFGSVSSPIRPPSNHNEFSLLSNDILYQTTPQYRAPEMVDLYRHLPIDEKCDIWALGCFLYKLCYYTTPFEAHGDIAILHASFLFLPHPPYSGDLKNLIIIMLQENPLYRPNIVQILTLVARMMNITLEELAVEDFYSAGPYDFQALHEMQQRKHDELMKQQQYYLDQQKQQSEYEQKKRRQHMLALPASAIASPQLPPQSSAPSGPDRSYNPFPLPDAHVAVNPSAVPSVVDPAAEPAEPAGEHSEADAETSASVDDADSNLEADLQDIAKMANAEERFPSLDALDSQDADISPVLAATGGSSGKVDVGAPADKSNEATTPIGEGGVSSEGLVRSLNASSVDFSRDLEKAKSRQSSSSHSRKEPSELESKEAWVKGLQTRIDKDAEQLVDDIFASKPSAEPASSSATAGAGAIFDPPAHSQSHLSDPLGLDSMPAETPSLPKVPSSVGSSDASLPQVELQKIKSTDFPKDNRGSEDFLQRSKSQSHRKNIFSIDDYKRPAPMQQSPLFTPPTSTEKPPMKLLSLSYSHLPMADSTTGSGGSNPWRSLLQFSRGPSYSDQYGASEKHISQGLDSLKLGGENDSSNDKKKDDNLIELEVGLNSSSSDTDNLPPPPLPPHPPVNRSYEEPSLLDLDMDANDDKVKVRPADKLVEDKPEKTDKPKFKTRLSQNPLTQLNVKEEVIDFESDDENKKSEMNRMNIRNSLRKSRKSSDYRRSDSSHSDNRKRLSFFGGSDDR